MMLPVTGMMAVAPTPLASNAFPSSPLVSPNPFLTSGMWGIQAPTSAPNTKKIPETAYRASDSGEGETMLDCR